MGDAWGTHGGRMGDAWGTPGGRLGDAWGTHEGHECQGGKDDQYAFAPHAPTIPTPGSPSGSASSGPSGSAARLLHEEAADEDEEEPVLEPKGFWILHLHIRKALKQIDLVSASPNTMEQGGADRDAGAKTDPTLGSASVATLNFK